MEALATILLTISAATWVGAILFQSVIVAPAVFVDLDMGSARRFLRTLFPRFYRLGVGCGLLMAAGILMLVGFAGRSSSLLAVAAATALMLVLELISLWLVPRINAARDAGEAAAGRFERLHRLSVILTVIILLLGIAVLSFVGVKAAPGLAS